MNKVKIYIIFMVVLCSLLSLDAFGDTPLKLSENALVGSYSCYGWDHQEGNYVVSNLNISLDKKINENSNNSLGFYSYKMEITSSSIPGSYVGSMIIDPLNLTGADALGGNSKKPEDYGCGIVKIEGILPNGKVAKLSITYYEPKYHVNGSWTCVNKVGEK